MNLPKSNSLPLLETIQRTGLHIVSNGNEKAMPFSFVSEAYNTSGYTHNSDAIKNSFSILETERLKIGHELHDSVNPLLAVAKLYMEIIKTATPRERLAKKEAISFILMAIQNIRQISSELVISQKKEFDLIKMIAALVKRINTTGVFKITFTAQRKKELKALTDQEKMNLYRIIQEQLNNTIKYSRSKLVKILLTHNNGMVNLEIMDDGVGFDTSKPMNGIGLSNIQSRVKNLNGRVEIISAPGKGCFMHVAFSAALKG